MAGASSASSSKMPSSSSTTPKSKGKLSLRAGGAAPSSSKLAPAPKRARFQDAGDDDDDDREESDAADFEDEDEDDDEEAIGAARAAAGRSEKTAKRKRRALDPSAFGSALDDFLGMGDDEPSTEVAAGDVDDGEAAPTEAAPSRKRKAGGGSGGQAPIFALAPSVRSRISSSTLSAKAGRLATEERRTRMDRFRVRDVIGGWGKPGELPSDQALADGSDAEEDAVDGGAGDFSSKLHERALRKVAQRGVVKLFNAIRAAQSTSLPEDDDGAAATKKSKDSSSSAAVDAKAGDVTSRNNALGGKGRQLNDLSKANFLDLLKSGKRAKAA